MNPSETPARDRKRASGHYEIRCSAEIEVRLDRSADEAQFHFAATAAQGVLVHADGEIHLQEVIGPNERAVLHFHLVGVPLAELAWEGVRLGRSENEANDAPVTADTKEAYYYQTPFKVANESREQRVTTLILTQVGGLVPRRHNPFFYVLSVLEGKRVYRHDPKIYNKGDGLPPKG